MNFRLLQAWIFLFYMPSMIFSEVNVKGHRANGKIEKNTSLALLGNQENTIQDDMDNQYDDTYCIFRKICTHDAFLGTIIIIILWVGAVAIIAWIVMAIRYCIKKRWMPCPSFIWAICCVLEDDEQEQPLIPGDTQGAITDASGDRQNSTQNGHVNNDSVIINQAQSPSGDLPKLRPMLPSPLAASASGNKATHFNNEATSSQIFSPRKPGSNDTSITIMPDGAAGQETEKHKSYDHLSRSSTPIGSTSSAAAASPIAPSPRDDLMDQVDLSKAKDNGITSKLAKQSETFSEDPNSTTFSENASSRGSVSSPRSPFITNNIWNVFRTPKIKEAVLQNKRG